MKFKKLAMLLATAGASIGLISCGNSKPEISIYVGNESVAFYKKAASQFLQENKDFGYNIRVIAADTGTMGGTMITDNTSCADIVTIAHDNIGKLAEKNLIRPIIGEELLSQIEADNLEIFKKVIKSKVTIQGQTYEYTYAAPYITQALFLMYNKEYVSETQAQSFEGLKEAALAARTATGKSSITGCTITGTSGYDFSFTILARNNETKYTSMQIYEDLVKLNCFAQGEDSVANVRWAQDAFEDGTLTWPNDSGFAVMMSTKTTLGVISGSWNFDAVASALGGADKVGVAMIPTYTLTASQVEGTSMEAGTVMRGGSYYDCKVFCINAASARSKYEAEQKIIQYLTSREIQNQSFVEAMNIPAYKDSMEYIESVKDQISAQAYQLAKVHQQMSDFGIPQPFINPTFNNYYYQAGGPDLYKNCIQEKGTVRAVREMLFRLEYVWKWGAGTLDKLVIPEVLPGDTNTKAS